MLQPSGPVQSTYNRYAVAGMVGTPVDETPYNIDTRICQDDSSPATGIGFGLAVQQGTDGDKAAAFGGSGTFVGITRSNPTQNVQTFTDKYSDGDNMPVFTVGDIWVIAEAAVTANEAVYYNPTTGVLGHSGGTLISGAKWLTATTGASQIAAVRLGAAEHA